MKKKMLLGIVLIVCLLVIITTRGFGLITEGNMTTGLYGSRIAIWLSLGLLFIYVKMVEKQPFLLLKDEKTRSLSFYFLSVVVLFALYIVVNIIVSQLIRVVGSSSADSPTFEILKKTLHNNLFLLIFTCLTAAITEELFFRGYILARLQKLIHSDVWSVILSALLFAITHLRYGTLAEFIGPFLIGLYFGWFYIKYKRISILIITHFIIDFLAIYLQK